MNTKLILAVTISFLFLVLTTGFSFSNFSSNSDMPILASTPTKRYSYKKAQFNLNKANKIPPANIINQISVTGRGGGEQCKDSRYSKPVLVGSSTETQELMSWVSIPICGWNKNENITSSVMFPNGKKISLTTENYTSNGVHSSLTFFKPGIDDPSGKYIFTVSGQSGSIQKVVNFTIPKGPRLYEADSFHLLLYGFSSSEKIRLFNYAYGGRGELKGWQEYTVGSDGNLEIEVYAKINVRDVYIIVGEKSGEIRTSGLSGIDQRTILLGDSYCGGLASRVKIGDQVMATYTDGSNLRIRSAPGFSQNFEHKVPEGTKMSIIGGPKCADNSTWWKVKISADITGWVAEYWNRDEYLIEPAP